MKLRHLTTGALALILIAGCGDDNGTGTEPDDIAGTWTATSMIFTQTASPNDTEDLVDAGAVLTLVLAADETYTFTFVLLPDENENESGTYTTTSSTITITPTGGTAESFGLTVNGDTMTLTDDNETFDFGGTGVEEDASLVITLTRP